MLSFAKTLIISLGLAILVYCTYAVFQADDYEIKIQQKISLNQDVALQKISDLASWPEWTEPESKHLRYQIDTDASAPVLRWMSASIVTKEALTDTTNTAEKPRKKVDGQAVAEWKMIGYRQLSSIDGNRLKFTVRDGTMAVYKEQITIKPIDANSSIVTWVVQSSNADIVEKLYRPAVSYFIKSRYETYLENLNKATQ